MIKKLVVLVLMLQCTNLYCQWIQYPVDSAIRYLHLSEKDWIISLTIQIDGSHYNDLGKRDSSDANGTFIIKKINDSCYIQRIKSDYNDVWPILKSSKQKNVYDSIVCSYTKDSILKSDREWIYPFIYKDDSLGIYQALGQSDHSPCFQLYMRTNQSEYQQQFLEIDLFSSPAHSELYSAVPKNLNSMHNINTFVYRAFINLAQLLMKHYQIYLLNSISANIEYYK